MNYTCVNSRVGGAVIKTNPSSFSKYADGASGFPKDPLDCWLLCYFNTILGNSTYGYPGMKAAAITVSQPQVIKPRGFGGSEWRQQSQFGVCFLRPSRREGAGYKTGLELGIKKLTPA